MKKTLYPPDYKTRDTRKYLYLFPSYTQSVRINHSFSVFHNSTLLDLFTQFANAQEEKHFIVPLTCFSTYRKNKIAQSFFTWQIGTQTYALVPATTLKASELQNYVEFLDELKWNYET